MLSGRVTYGKRSFPFVCALLPTVCAMAGLGCERKHEVPSGSASASVKPSSVVTGPRLEVSPKQLDLGVLTQNEPVERRIEVRHLGTSTVHFREEATSNRCRWDTSSGRLAAGAVVSRVIRCQSDLLGPLKETLSFAELGTGQRQGSLDIVGTVQPLVGFETAFVDLQPEYGQTVHKDVGVIGAKATTAKLKVKDTGPSVVTVTTVTVPTGQAPRYRLTCKADRVGMHAGSLIVTTGLPAQPELSLSWGCKVPGTLEVNPTNPYFNLRVSGDRAASLEVKSRQSGFKVHSVTITEGPFTATVEPGDSEGSYRVVLKVVNARIPDEARSASGTLLIVSNDVREPRKEVPLFGFGHVNKVEHPE